MSTNDAAEQRLVRHYRKAVGQCSINLHNDFSKFNRPAASSPFARDSATTKSLALHKQRHPRLRLLVLNLEQSIHKIANVGDHLRAMEAIFALDPPLVYSPSSMTRVAVEAAASVRSLLDATIDTEERILRASSALLESYQHNLNATQKLRVDLFSAAVPAAERRLNALVKLVERAGLEVKRQANGKPTNLRWSGATAFRRVPHATTTDLVADAFSGYPALYQLGSGVAHSMEWMLGDNAQMAAEGPPLMTYKSNPYANGAAAIAAVAAVEVVIAEYGRYMGFEPEDVLVPYRRRRETLDRYMNDYASGRRRASGRL